MVSCKTMDAVHMVGT